MRVRSVAVGLLVVGLLGVGAPLAGATTAAPASLSPASTTTGLRGSLGALGPLGPLTDLLIDRLKVADDVAAAKFGTSRPIDDPVREQQLLDRVRVDAAANGLDPDAAVRVFRDQIEANKVVQRGLFARWTAHPDEAPTVRPDLATLRARLDRLTTAILAELLRTERLREAGVACHVQLALATRSGATLRHLDALHREALVIAESSLCSERHRSG